jgi:hypothetical protein
MTTKVFMLILILLIWSPQSLSDLPKVLKSHPITFGPQRRRFTGPWSTLRGHLHDRSRITSPGPRCRVTLRVHQPPSIAPTDPNSHRLVLRVHQPSRIILTGPKSHHQGLKSHPIKFRPQLCRPPRRFTGPQSTSCGHLLDRSLPGPPSHRLALRVHKPSSVTLTGPQSTSCGHLLDRSLPGPPSHRLALRVHKPSSVTLTGLKSPRRVFQVCQPSQVNLTGPISLHVVSEVH